LTDELKGHVWWKLSPFYYTSMFDYRCFRLNKVKLGLYKHRLRDRHRKLMWIVQKIIYSRKCKNCNHPLFSHVSYDKTPDKKGVCIDWNCAKPCEVYA